MDLLQYYPKIEEATRQHASVKNTYQTLLSIYNGTKRFSGRLVIEDFKDVSYDDVRAISGSGFNGEK